MADGNLDIGFRSGNKNTFYEIPKDQLTALFADKNSVSNESKVITTLHYLFPAARPNISENYEKGTFESSSNSRHEVSEITDHNQFMFATVAAVFSEYCSTAEYLYTRVANVCRFCGIEVPPFSEFENYINAISWFDTNTPRNLKTQIGWIVAINKQGSVCPEVHEYELMTIKEYRIVFDGTTDWALALLSEARVVYSYYHMKLLWTGIHIVPKIRKVYRAHVFILAAEIGRIESVIPSIEKRPYIGLHNNLPNHLQTFAHAKVVYIGVLYHNRMANDVTKEVNTSEITEYIINECRAGDYFKKQCEIIAKNLK